MNNFIYNTFFQFLAIYGQLINSQSLTNYVQNQNEFQVPQSNFASSSQTSNSFGVQNPFLGSNRFVGSQSGNQFQFGSQFNSQTQFNNQGFTGSQPVSQQFTGSQPSNQFNNQQFTEFPVNPIPIPQPINRPESVPAINNQVLQPITDNQIPPVPQPIINQSQPDPTTNNQVSSVQRPINTQVPENQAITDSQPALQSQAIAAGLDADAACYSRSCDQVVTGRGLSYQRALEVLQEEDYLTEADRSVIRKKRSPNLNFPEFGGLVFQNQNETINESTILTCFFVLVACGIIDGLYLASRANVQNVPNVQQNVVPQQQSTNVSPPEGQAPAGQPQPGTFGK